MMGYTSSSVWGKLYPPKSTIITNMDGLEWKRSKYSKNVQQFLKYAEKLAVKYSQYYISDSLVINSYLGDKYNHKIKYQFNWEKIIDQYEDFILDCHYNSTHEQII
jgi:hypothetical protein